MLERRRILKDRMTEIPNRIMLSEVYEVHVRRETNCYLFLHNSRIADCDSHLISGSTGSGAKNRVCVEIRSRGFGPKGYRCKY